MTTLPQLDHQKISFTAKLVALGRSFTDIPFAKDVSELVGAPSEGDALDHASAGQGAIPKLMIPILEARYLSLESAIKRSGVSQVLEFASGVSLRGLAMTLADPRLTYVETDLPDLTAEKQLIIATILKRRGLARPPRHHVAVANILDRSDIDAVLSSLAAGAPVAVVHEGLFMYLNHEEKTIAARHIARILDTFGGVWITPDLTPISRLDVFFEHEKENVQRTMEAIESRTGCSFAAYSFDSDEAARTFCEGLGFSVEEHPMLDGSYTLTSVPAHQLRAFGERAQHALKVWEMRRVPRANH